MSGICGLVHFDGAPPDRDALRAMAAAMAFRGPDRMEMQVRGGAGLAHALLRTDPDAPDERQPLTFDGRAWIVADGRIDAQAELRGALAERGRVGLEGCGDTALILHAWHAWGEDCVRHLLGDFAFAVWDEVARRLFLAHDHFGVKPLFYARFGSSVAFANTLDCLRTHPGVGTELDDLAIADCLLFERALDPEATAFASIRRLRPAGWLRLDPQASVTGSYWQPPRDIEPRRKSSGDEAEGLREVLQLAVNDRLRSPRIALQMSGGLDSTALAALARGALQARQRPFELRAHTIVYDRLLPDQERHYSTLAGEALGIPVTHYAGDDHGLYERFDTYQARFPAPFHGPDLIAGFDCLRGAARHARILLTGYDGDTLLSESPKPYFRWLRDKRRYGTLAASVVRYAISQRRFWPRAVNSSGAGMPVPAFPVWVDEGLARRLDLRARWHAFQNATSDSHPIRPMACENLAEMMRTTALFDQYDAGVTGLALECRHPFIDLRVIAFCLGLAPEPECIRKAALRRAIRGILPEAIRRRPKTPLAGWAGACLLQRPESRWIDRFDAAPELERFVRRDLIAAAWGGVEPMRAWQDLRPLSLNFWLRTQRPRRLATEDLRHEIA